MPAGCSMTGRRRNEFPMEQQMNRSLSGAAPSDEDLRLIDAWWRAANYLSVGQIYLLDNPLLERSLERADLKPTAARSFRHDARPEFRLRASEPCDQGAQPQRHLYLWP